jgi:hypothetical protein
MKDSGRCGVFVSYSHADRPWLERLKVHLEPLVRESGMAVWDDSAIRPGSRWKDEIKDGLAGASVAVLLVSPDFLASPFIAREEVPPILSAAASDGLRVLWVPLRPSVADATPLAEFQAAWDPKKPLTALPKAKADAALVEIARAIYEAHAAGVRHARPSRNTRTEEAAASPVDALLPQLDDVSLVRGLLTRTWSLRQLQDAVRQDPAAAASLVARVGRAGGASWARLIGSFAASVNGVDPAPIVALAFGEAVPGASSSGELASDGPSWDRPASDGPASDAVPSDGPASRRLSWGGRFYAVSALRFAPSSARRAAAEALDARARWSDSTGWDDARVALYGLGFLGADTTTYHVLDRAGVLDDRYAAEKLGPYGILSLLQAYLNEPWEAVQRNVLGYLTTIYEATDRHGELRLDFFDYIDELQTIRAGQAVGLFRHFRDRGWSTPLQALLSALGSRSNPVLVDELLELARRSADGANRGVALHAVALVGSHAATEALRKEAAGGDRSAVAAYYLAIGAARAAGARHDLAGPLGEIGHLGDHHWLEDVAGNAVWSVGQLGQDDPGFARPLLEPLTTGPDDTLRGLAWLGLAKSGASLDGSRAVQAMDIATSFLERLLVATAAALAGNQEPLFDGLRGTIENYAPLYRMLPHLRADVCRALAEHAGPGGKDLCRLLELGDFTC